MDTIGGLWVSVNELVETTEALNRVRLGTEEACRLLQQSIDRRFREIERLLSTLEDELRSR